MSHGFPDDPAEFNQVMLEVDQELASSGYSIPQRPTNALGKVSKSFSVPLPITKPHAGFQHEVARYWPISERIYAWYELRYGDRLKMDFSPGRMAILIEEDVWVLRFPRIYGSVSLTVSRTIRSERVRSDGRPAVFNVVDAVENLPRSRVPMLPDNELEHIFEKFRFGLEAFGVLEGSGGHELVKLVLADISAAVEHLVQPKESYGLSKWSSLQAAEKLFKAAISGAGGSYSNTHNLEKLCKQAEAAGLKGDWHTLIPHIQCSPAIRYGEDACDRDSAVLAHHAALGLAIMLKEGGAAFISNLSLQPTR